jgi:hypothetical protein
MTHNPYCSCRTCLAKQANNTVYPVSTLNAGLFAVRPATVKLADLTNGSGVKLADCVPKSALTVSIRNVSIDDLCIDRHDGKSLAFMAQETVELPVGDLDKFTTSYEGAEGCSVAVSYTVLMGKAG